MRLKRIDTKQLGILFFFCASMLNRYILMAFLLFLVFRGRRNVSSAVDGLIIISIRTILNPQIAVDISTAQTIKWLSIFVLSGFIFFRTFYASRRTKVNNQIILVVFFGLFISIISLFNSCYPIVSIFKCFSYAFVFICVILGVDFTRDSMDWAEHLYKYFTLLFFTSALLSPFSFSYYSSARWYMGITNQSQMFAIMAVLYLSLLLYRMINGHRSLFQTIMLCVTFVLTYLSGSRTGIIAAAVCIIYAIYIEVVKNRRYAIVVILFCSVIVIFLLGYQDEVMDLFRTALLKGQADSSTAKVSFDTLTSSRYKQYLTFMEKFKNDFLFGSGFMVPFTPGIKDWNLSFSLIVENGNLFYSLLGDIGVMGLMLFVVCYGHLFLKGNKGCGRIILFIAPFIICMGEMVFFSTNNNAPILYVMLSYYLCGE